MFCFTTHQVAGSKNHVADLTATVLSSATQKGVA